MAIWVWASAAVAFLNIAMTIYLLSIYAENYRRIKSPLTMGLLLFGTLFVITNLAIVGFWLFLFTTLEASSIAEQAFAYIFVINVGVALAVGNLLRVTLR